MNAKVSSRSSSFPRAPRSSGAGAPLMRACLRERYGDASAIRLGEVPRPVPGPRQLLVRVRASSVNQADWYLLTGTPYPLRLMTGVLRPRQVVLGLDAAGVVEAVGAAVTRFRPGDEVYGELAGSFAEYACADEDRVARKPASLSFEEAAAVPVAAVTALQGLRDKARLAPGHRVLINGASGGVGTFAIQIARVLGAEVTAVCSARNLEQARALGATRVLDYARADFSAPPSLRDFSAPPSLRDFSAPPSLRDFSDTDRYDAIFDLAGSVPLRGCLARLRPCGVYVCSVGRLGWIAKAFAASLLWRGTVTVLAAQARAEDLASLGALFDAGLIAPVIERRYAFDELAEALRAQGAGHARGKSVVSLDGVSERQRKGRPR